MIRSWKHLRHTTKELVTNLLDGVRELYELVGLNPEFMHRYPHEYSGGMKQRAIIAMALACEPDLIIADEPTTALDVIVQDRILREMKEVQRKLDMSMIYISHDMAVIAEVSDVVGVMYAGKIVEYGPTTKIFDSPDSSVHAGIDVGLPKRCVGRRRSLQLCPENLPIW